MDEKNDTPMIPLYQAENTIMHMSYANKRMLVALLVVCVTFILTITVFVIGYTIREKNWLDTITKMQRTPAVTDVTEVQNGIYEYADKGAK